MSQDINAQVGREKRIQGGEALSLFAVWTWVAYLPSLGLNLLLNSIMEAKCNDL